MGKVEHLKVNIQISQGSVATYMRIVCMYLFRNKNYLNRTTFAHVFVKIVVAFSSGTRCGKM